MNSKPGRAFLGMSHSPLLGLNPLPAGVHGQLQAAIDDPTSADAAEITQQASELSASAAQLTSANPDDVDRINECAALLSVTP